MPVAHVHAPARRRRGRRLAAVALGAGLPLVLAACGSSAPTATSSSTTVKTVATTSTTAAPTATTTTTSAPATTTTTPATTTTAAPPVLATVPMQTANGGEFYSPSHNISCEVDYQRSGIATATHCQTVTPPRSVTMTATGTLKPCTGQQCLGNAGLDTPTLPYGTATGVGPFRCVSQVTGVTCTAGGKGFRISKSGITPVTATS